MYNYTPIKYNPYLPPSAQSSEYVPNQGNTPSQYDVIDFNNRLNAILGIGQQPAQAAAPQNTIPQQNTFGQPMAQYGGGGGARPMNEFATPLQSQSALQGSGQMGVPSNSYNQDQPGAWDTFRDKAGRWIAGNIGQYVPATLGSTFGTALAGPVGGMIGGAIGNYVGQDVKSTIMNPVEGNDPYAKFRPATGPDNNGSFTSPESDSYANYTPDSYSGYTTGSNQNYKPDNNGSFKSPTSDSYANYTPGSYSGYTTGSNQNYTPAPTTPSEPSRPSNDSGNKGTTGKQSGGGADGGKGGDATKGGDRGTRGGF